jgi:diguanylate cyclase (GGDEF)-like protein/PAS domain S-box-containing protein
MHDLIHHSFADGSPMPVEVCRIFKAYREGARMHVDDEVLWRADGSSFPAEYWSYPQLRDGQVVGAVVTFIDISERRATEAALVRERQRLGYILEGTNVGTWEWNVQTGETVFNDRWAGMLGFNLAELEPTSIATWKRFAHPDDLAASTELLEKHFRGELAYYECEARLRHRSGEWIWVLDRGKVATWTSDGQPLLMCGTHQDITARKLAEEKIRHLANHDVLTDLPSLRLAKDRLNVALNAARRNQALVAVLFIDLDGFKQINDSFGHETGDCVLRQVAGRLSACGRGSDTVARIGGDEFLGLAAGLSSAADAAILAERMLESLTKPMACGERQATVGASIGIALYPIHASTTEDLIRLADEAMYRTKASGKNAYSFAE